MKKNDFPTNPVAFAQYVWENIEDGDTLMDKLQNIWEVSSYTIFDGRKIEINLCCVDSSKWAGGYYNGKHEKLTRYDLASKYYLYIDDEQVKIPAVEDWTVSTFVQNYNTIWSILDTMHSPTTSPTKEEKEDIHKLLLLTQEADKKYEGKIEQLSTLRTLDGLKNKIEKETEKCLPKEDKQMAENEKNYFPKNKGKTGADTQLKSAFYSNEEFCTRLVDTFFNASDFSKKTLGELKNFLKEKYNDYKNDYENYIEEKSKKDPELETQSETKIINVNDNKPIITIDNNDTDTGTHKVSSTDTEQPKPVFKLGDVVYNNNNSVGYISRLGYADKYCYYYWTPLFVSYKDRTYNYLEVGKELGLIYPYETYYKRIGNYLMSDPNCIKEITRIDSVYKLNEDNLKKFPYLNRYVTDFKTQENDEKDSNTSASNDTTPSDTAPSSSRENLIISSLPNYLRKLNLIDSTYNYEVNTKLTTDTAEKLNDVIEALNDVIRYLQDNK